MTKEAKYFPYEIASSVIQLIKNGYVQNVGASLDYALVKTGIELNERNNVQIKAWMDVLESIKKFNSGYMETNNCQRTFKVFAENKKSELYRESGGLPFTRADLLFEIYKKKGQYPDISLFEDIDPIRVYKKGVGEKRDIRYETITGLSGIVARPEHTTYKDIAVQTNYIYHQDSGHGWLEVPARELKRMGLEDQVSPYSYLHQGKAYLEEDLDMGTFLEIRKLLPRPVDVQSNYIDGSCFIRDYPHYRPENIMPEKPARKNTRSKDVGWER